MATQPVSFYVPNVVVTISDRDVEHLLDRLRSVGNPNAPGRDCAGAHQLIDAARQVPPETDVPLKLDGGRLDAVLRALDHLHSTSLFSRSLTRLRDTLISTSGPPTWTAEVQLGYGAKCETLYSYSGTYVLDDLLPPHPEGENWRVVDIRDTGGRPLIVARRSDSASSPSD